MNANEIADELDGRLDHVAANMLRQQQAEIGCYKIELDLHKAMIQDLENALKKAQEK